MVHIMTLMQDLTNGMFPSVDAAIRERSRTAFNRGLEGILNMQVFSQQQNMLTAWAQNYNPATLQPAWAREFEPPSISGEESVGVIIFLMSIPNPNERIVNAINSAVAFFAHVEIFGHRLVDGAERTLTTGPAAAGGLWARFICIDTFTPLLYDRRSPQWQQGEERNRPGTLAPAPGGMLRNITREDGTLDLVASFANLSHERRNGYHYFRNNAATLPEVHANWRARNGM
jgi:PelA/Pel-15E family pectate lyase